MAGNSEVSRPYIAIKTISYLCPRCNPPLQGWVPPAAQAHT